MQTIEWIMYGVSVASVIGNYYVVKQNKWGFLIWAISNGLWVAYDIYKTAYPQALLFTAFFFMSIWGFTHWHKQSTDK